MKQLTAALLIILAGAMSPISVTAQEPAGSKFVSAYSYHEGLLRMSYKVKVQDTPHVARLVRDSIIEEIAKVEGKAPNQARLLKYLRSEAEKSPKILSVGIVHTGRETFVRLSASKYVLHCIRGNGEYPWAFHEHLFESDGLHKIATLFDLQTNSQNRDAKGRTLLEHLRSTVVSMRTDLH